MVSYIVDLEPVGRRGKCGSDETIMDCARRIGVGINSVCGGQGTCRSCKVQVLDGAVTKPTSNEMEAFSQQELDNGWHLACQTYPRSNCKISVPTESMTTTQRVQVEGLEITVPPDPPVVAYHVKLLPPSLSDQQADAERMLDVLNSQHGLNCTNIDIDILRTLSTKLRGWNWECQAAVRSDEIIDVAPWPSRQLGIAIDLGTTKIAGYLVDLTTGRTLAAKGIMNPQIGYGEDIISRIAAAMRSKEKERELRTLVTEELNKLAFELCAEVSASIEGILESVIVGNTAMHHLFLGLPVGQIARSPFVSAVSGSLDVKARDLGLCFAPGAYVHLLPNIAGFIGSDHVAMLLSTEVCQSKGPILALDIGTNTEVSLVNKGKITAVSCASGPAFEGGHIKDGMRAATGAIERLRISDGTIQYQTIDQAPAVGMCGSGILDSLSQLFLSGIIDEGGRMVNNHPRVRTTKNHREYVLVDKKERHDQQAITITQLDVRELQLAKAAIRSGIQVLLEANGCSEDDIVCFIIAGAFGTYIDVTSAIVIGMLPAVPLDRFRQVGNAAGMGAKLALISLSKRAEAQAVASRATYIELATAPDFNRTFRQASYLGRYRITNGGRKEFL
jgi:uncharacterized 2Fe-2S/4Fe-4S cluster protein (DUF4445 family)